jgi:elongation factor P--(R)-beta-lysine ligase
VAWSVRERVAAWDAALTAVRACLRDQGMREAPTPIVVDEVALEPWIEPLSAGEGFLQTSPELAMKRLLALGSGSIFQIAAVARAGERGAWHKESFALVEWYRVDADPAAVQADVERIVAAVADALAPAAIAAPSSWTRIGFLDLLEEHGIVLRGDEDGDALARAHPLPGLRCRDPAARTLEAWTALFTEWSDAMLDPWLVARARAGQGVHLVDFPAPLAALAEHDIDARGRAIARRFESHAFGRELANGYGELRDATEQRARFVAVAHLRAAHGLPALPLPERFLAELDALPRCTGCALGLDRLVALVLGACSLADVAL